MPFLVKASLFVLLSLVDLSLTWLLLNFGGGGAIGEANPAARWFLLAHGWAGMAAFKAITVVVVLLSCSLLQRFRPQLAGRVLAGCSGVVAAVVLYSCLLTGYLGLVTHHIDISDAVLVDGTEADDELALVDDSRSEILGTRQSLVIEMLEGRYTLARAVQELEGVLMMDMEILEELKARYPERSDLECYALLLAEDVASELVHRPERAPRMARRMMAELQTYCRAEDAPEALKQLARYGKRTPVKTTEGSWSSPAASVTPLIGG